MLFSRTYRSEYQSLCPPHRSPHPSIPTPKFSVQELAPPDPVAEGAVPDPLLLLAVRLVGDNGLEW